jgi:tetratricopeptide (TPR) repeat protein
MISRHVLGLALLLAATATGGSLRADADTIQPSDRARVLSDQGRAYHAEGEYDRALGSFKAAYELAPSPGLLFNMAQAYRLKGDCDNAASMYRNYLTSQPDRPHRELAESHLENVEKCMSRRAKLQPLLGGRGDELAASGGATTTTGTVALDSPSPPGRTLKRTGVAVGIGGLALVGVGIYYAAQAADYGSQVEQMYADGEKWKDIEPIDAKGRRASKLATWFAIGGGAVALTGGALYLVGRRDAARAERSRTISITPGPDGGQVNVAWSW